MERDDNVKQSQLDLFFFENSLTLPFLISTLSFLEPLMKLEKKTFIREDTRSHIIPPTCSVTDQTVTKRIHKNMLSGGGWMDELRRIRSPDLPTYFY